MPIKFELLGSYRSVILPRRNTHSGNVDITYPVLLLSFELSLHNGSAVKLTSCGHVWVLCDQVVQRLWSVRVTKAIIDPKNWAHTLISNLINHGCQRLNNFRLFLILSSKGRGQHVRSCIMKLGTRQWLQPEFQINRTERGGCPILILIQHNLSSVCFISF